MVRRKRRQRLVVTVVGLGVLAVLAAGFASRDRLAAHWLLHLRGWGMPDYEIGEIIVLSGRDPADLARLIVGFSKGTAGVVQDAWLSRGPEHRRIEGFARYLAHLRGAQFTSDRLPGRLLRFLPGDEAGRRTGLYASVTTGRVGREDVVEARPPAWMTPADLEALHRATALVIESQGEGR